MDEREDFSGIKKLREDLEQSAALLNDIQLTVYIEVYAKTKNVAINVIKI